MKEIRIEDIKGFAIGQAEDETAGTGCTAIICEEGAIGGVDVRGGAPATRETDLLDPCNAVQQIHCVMLSGGSAFGLEAACGAMEYLEAKGIGFDMGSVKVPIVCGASLFDLHIGNPSIRPDKEMGKKACEHAGEPVLEGNYGAGCGCSIGKILGPDKAMKSGLGTFALQNGELQVGAIVAVNACGDIFDPHKHEIIGAAILNGKLMPLQEALLNGSLMGQGNTTIGCIVTNAKLDKAQVNKLATMTHDAYAHVITPTHTMSDGDTIFAMAHGTVEADLNLVGMMAVKCMEEAIVKGFKAATPAYGLAAYEG